MTTLETITAPAEAPAAAPPPAVPAAPQAAPATTAAPGAAPQGTPTAPGQGGPGGAPGFRPGGPPGPRPGGPRPYAPRGGPRSGGGPRPGGRPRGRYAPRRRVCTFCVEHIKDIDYKDFEKLRRFVSDRAKIEPRRKSGVCSKHQRALSNAIKRARHLALLPFVPLPPVRSSIRR